MKELVTVSKYGRVGHSVTKMKKWAQCHKIEEIGTVSQNGRDGTLSQNGRNRHSVTKWKKWAHCHKME